MGKMIGENAPVFWRLTLGLVVGGIVFVVVDKLTFGVFPAIAFGIGALAVWLIARR